MRCSWADRVVRSVPCASGWAGGQSGRRLHAHHQTRDQGMAKRQGIPTFTSVLLTNRSIPTIPKPATRPLYSRLFLSPIAPLTLPLLRIPPHRLPTLHDDYSFPRFKNLTGKSTYLARKNSATFLPSTSMDAEQLTPRSRWSCRRKWTAWRAGSSRRSYTLQRQPAAT